MLQLFCILAIACSAHAAGQGDQKFADIGDLSLKSGQTLRDCRVGYRTFGTLNAQKSNAVLVPTWYLGTSGDLAGSFKAGGLVDSAHYYVIAVDALGNGVSSSPSNSKSQPEGMFPKIAVRDMVESQHTLLQKLGINHLRAVLGISMGGIQTFQWITAYPDFMDRAVPIVGSPRATSYDLMNYGSGLKILRDAIGNKPTQTSLITAFADYFYLSLHTPTYYVRTTAREGALASMNGFEHAILAWDPYDMQCDLQALYDNDDFADFNESETNAAAAIKAKLLVICATQDHCVNPAAALSFAKALSAETILLNNDAGPPIPRRSDAPTLPAIAKFLDN